MTYRADIDGLRGIAILSVIAFHAIPGIVPGGFVGVDIFFVISGYLISSIILKKLDDGTFTFSGFYARRVKRIFPSLCVVLAGTWAIGWLSLFPGEFRALGKHIVAGSVFLSNVLLWLEAGYFDVGAELKPLLHLWSLAVEEQFYIVWPFVIFIIWKKRLNYVVLVPAIIAASFVLDVSLVRDHPTSTFYFLHARLWELITGALLAHPGFQRNMPFQSESADLVRRRGAEGRRIPWGDIAGWLGLSLVAVSIIALDREAPYPGWRALLPVLGTSLIIWGGNAESSANRVLAGSGLVWIGLISYPLYLWHWPLLSFARIISVGEPSPTVVAAVVGISFLLAWLTYRLVEIPIRFGFGNVAVKRTVCGLGATLIGFGGLGFLTYFEGGFPVQLSRFEMADASLESLKVETYDCKKRFPFSEDGFCHLSSSDLKSRHITLFIGDSHLQALAQAFDAHAKRNQPASVYLAVGKGGCIPLLGVERVTNGVSTHCAEFMKGIMDFVARNSNVRTVVIVARYAAYAWYPLTFDERQLPYGHPSQASGVRPLHGQATPADVFRAGLVGTLDFLQKRNVEIIFVHQVPEIGFDPRLCTMSRPFRAVIERPLCARPRSEVDVFQRQYRDIVRGVLANYPAVKVLDPTQYFCDDKRCYGMRDGETAYRDGSHVSFSGAYYLLSKYRIE